MFLRTILATTVALSISASAQDTLSEAELNRLRDSVEKSLSWKTGHIELPGGKAALDLPEGYRYLDPENTQIVLENLWGNPNGEGTLGMIFAPGQTPDGDSSWGVVVGYDDEGHVDDKDAAEIDYDELLENMKKESQESNAERTAAGYGAVTLEGWAEKPHYDANEKKLWWAKTLVFGDHKEKTLNYYVRILGREGVLELNAVSGLPQLATVHAGMASLNKVASFTEGNRYADFNEDTDKLSSLGIAALVGGGVAAAAKTGLLKGLFVALLAMKKFVVVGLLAAFAGLKAWWDSRRKAKEERESRFGGADPEA